LARRQGTGEPLEEARQHPPSEPWRAFFTTPRIDPPAKPIRQIVAGKLNLTSDLNERIAQA